MNKQQSWGLVFVQEFKRIIVRPRTLIALGIFAVVAVGASLGLSAALDWSLSLAANEGVEINEAPPFVGFGLVSSVLSFALGLLATSSTARDYADGAAAATVVLVPKRSRLLSARMVIWALVAAAITLVSGAFVVLVLAAKVGDMGAALLNLACVTFGVCVLTLVGFASATLMRKGSLSVITFLGIDLIGPMVLGMVSGFMPEIIRKVLDVVSKLLPGNALVSVEDFAAGLAEHSNDGYIGLGILAAWIIVSAVVSYVAFSRYAGAEE